MRYAFAAVVFAGLAGCAGGDAADPVAADDTDLGADALPAPLLPSEGGAFAPSLMEAPPGVSGEALADIDVCTVCHADVAAQWEASAHGNASFGNPIYRVSVESVRASAGVRASQFCGGCHDVPLTVDGAMLTDVVPADDRAKNGVTCRVCHGVERATPDGNGSFVLTADPIELPVDGDDASVARHKASAALAPLRTAALCGSCHKSFLTTATGNDHFLPGQNELGIWRRTGYAGSPLARIDQVEASECRGCHMPDEPAVRGDAAATDGMVASHRFAGGHTWLASMRGDDEQMAATVAMLRRAATIDVAAIESADGSVHVPADGAPVAAGEAVTIDVVARNVGVGHRFPGGVLDAQDTWIEVDVRDARGRLLARSDPDDRHVLRAEVVGVDGAPLLAREVDRFAAVAWNHTIPPRDAAGVQFALAVPADVEAWPLTIRARLRHRSRRLALQRATCDEARSARGQAFSAARRARGEPVLDPCAPQPITDIATAAVEIGAGAALATQSERTWQRIYDHGLAWLHVVQERLDEGRASFERALGAAGRRNGMAALGFASLAAHQGRVDEALEWADRAEAVVPSHPAIARTRGVAYARVWRWRDAVPHLRAAARAAPNDHAAWSALAIAEGSAGEPRAAYAAARAGLALEPRDPDLLRAQALALRALDDPRADAALSAWHEHRRRDDAPDLRARCGDTVPGCQRERDPVHVHTLIDR